MPEPKDIKLGDWVIYDGKRCQILGFHSSAGSNFLVPKSDASLSLGLEKKYYSGNSNVSFINDVPLDTPCTWVNKSNLTLATTLQTGDVVKIKGIRQPQKINVGLDKLNLDLSKIERINDPKDVKKAVDITTTPTLLKKEIKGLEFEFGDYALIDDKYYKILGYYKPFTIINYLCVDSSSNPIKDISRLSSDFKPDLARCGDLNLIQASDKYSWVPADRIQTICKTIPKEKEKEKEKEKDFDSTKVSISINGTLKTFSLDSYIKYKGKLHPIAGIYQYEKQLYKPTDFLIQGKYSSHSDFATKKTNSIDARYFFKKEDQTLTKTSQCSWIYADDIEAVVPKERVEDINKFLTLKLGDFVTLKGESKPRKVLALRTGATATEMGMMVESFDGEFKISVKDSRDGLDHKANKITRFISKEENTKGHWVYMDKTNIDSIQPSKQYVDPKTLKIGNQVKFEGIEQPVTILGINEKLKQILVDFKLRDNKFESSVGAYRDNKVGNTMITGQDHMTCFHYDYYEFSKVERVLQEVSPQILPATNSQVRLGDLVKVNGFDIPKKVIGIVGSSILVEDSDGKIQAAHQHSHRSSFEEYKQYWCTSSWYDIHTPPDTKCAWITAYSNSQPVSKFKDQKIEIGDYVSFNDKQKTFKKDIFHQVAAIHDSYILIKHEDGQPLEKLLNPNSAYLDGVNLNDKYLMIDNLNINYIVKSTGIHIKSYTPPNKDKSDPNLTLCDLKVGDKIDLHPNAIDAEYRDKISLDSHQMEIKGISGDYFIIEMPSNYNRYSMSEFNYDKADKYNISPSLKKDAKIKYLHKQWLNKTFRKSDSGKYNKSTQQLKDEYKVGDLIVSGGNIKLITQKTEDGFWVGDLCTGTNSHEYNDFNNPFSAAPFKLGHWIRNTTSNKLFRIEKNDGVIQVFDVDNQSIDADQFFSSFNIGDYQKTGFDHKVKTLTSVSTLDGEVYRVGDTLLLHDGTQITVDGIWWNGAQPFFFIKTDDDRATSATFYDCYLKNSPNNHYFKGTLDLKSKIKSFTLSQVSKKIVPIPTSSIRSEFIQSGHRLAARKLTQLFKQSLVTTFRSKNNSKSALQNLVKILDSQYGQALISYLLGLTLDKIPNKSSLLTSIQHELHIDSVMWAQDALFQSVFSTLKNTLISANSEKVRFQIEPIQSQSEFIEEDDQFSSELQRMML